MSRGSASLGELIEPAKLRRAGHQEFPILSMTMHGGLIDQGQKFKKRIASLDTSTYKVVTRGQLVVGFPIDEGVLSFQDQYDEAVVSPAYEIWNVIDPLNVDSKYLERYLRSSRAITYYRSKLRGTTARRRSLPRDVFLDLPITLPEVPEQRRIAQFLDSVEALLAKRREAIALLDDLAQSIFLDMFGDPELNPRGWGRRRFGSLLEIPLRNGLSPSTGGKFYAKVLTLSAITGSHFNPSAFKVAPFNSKPPEIQAVRATDFLICRGNGNANLVGRGVFPSCDMLDTTFPDTVISARPSPLHVAPDYLRHAWESTEVRRQIRSAARTTNGTFKINQKMLELIEVPVPPLELQMSFVDRIRKVSNSRSLQQSHLAELDALFAALQHRAFRGEMGDALVT